jgi:uncharacterized SAM-binding protein YcdF (DUF218 family)
MFSALSPARRRLWLKRLTLLLLSIPLVIVAQQMALFAQTCQIYAERADQAVANLPKEVSPHEAIVVLTGDRKRIPRAFALLRTRQSPVLLISGAGKGTTLTDLVNQQGSAANMVHEVWNKILVESKSSSTVENARETGKILIPRGVTDIILITSEYHMPRASAIFHQVLPQMKIIEYPVTSDVTKIEWFDFSTRALRGVWFFWNEFWKSVLYRVYTSHQLHPLSDQD